MTVEDCKDALRLTEDRAAYVGALETLHTYSYIDSEPIKTGRGTETITVKFQTESVKADLLQRITDVDDKLLKLGVTI
jgi:hypothetical protein